MIVNGRISLILFIALPIVLHVNQWFRHKILCCYFPSYAIFMRTLNFRWFWSYVMITNFAWLLWPLMCSRCLGWSISSWYWSIATSLSFIQILNERVTYWSLSRVKSLLLLFLYRPLDCILNGKPFRCSFTEISFFIRLIGSVIVRFLINWFLISIVVRSSLPSLRSTWDTWDITMSGSRSFFGGKVFIISAWCFLFWLLFIHCYYLNVLCLIHEAC